MAEAVRVKSKSKKEKKKGKENYNKSEHGSKVTNASLNVIKSNESINETTIENSEIQNEVIESLAEIVEIEESTHSSLTSPDCDKSSTEETSSAKCTTSEENVVDSKISELVSDIHSKPEAYVLDEIASVSNDLSGIKTNTHMKDSSLSSKNLGKIENLKESKKDINFTAECILNQVVDQVVQDLKQVNITYTKLRDDLCTLKVQQERENPYTPGEQSLNTELLNPTAPAYKSEDSDAFIILSSLNQTIEKSVEQKYTPVTQSAEMERTTVQEISTEIVEKCKSDPDTLSKTTAKTTVIHKKIISLKPEAMKPFTESQLKALYYNPELETNETFIETFIEQHRSGAKHEFHELLLGYLKARSNLITSNKDIQSLHEDYKRMREQLWITTEHSVSVKGQCDDGRNVTGSHQFLKVKFNDIAGGQVTRILRQIREEIHNNHSLHAYSAQMSRLQIESYLYNLLLACPDLIEIPHNTPIQGFHPSQFPPSIIAQVTNLKECISILFAFQRKPIRDKQFTDDTREWLTRLVAVMLRASSFDDHLFLLNHVLRCPAGVEDWAATFIQLPIPSFIPDWNVFHDPSLNHMITVLADILAPVRAREEFLQHVKMAMSSSSDEDSIWVLVDSEGEEDEDPENHWHRWRENDLVALLNQIPIESIFRVILRINTRDDIDIYDVNLTNDQDMLRLLAFSTQLVHILREGLKTYNLVRYRQLTKRISRLIRHTVQYISDHWLNVMTSGRLIDPSLKMRLQVEFDQFFLRATYCIFSSQRLGAWQFMAGLPYICVSTDMLWKILWLLHNNYQENQDLDELEMMNWRKELKDPGLKLQFEESLATMPECEAYYLLTAFTNMACSRNNDACDLVEYIALEVYEIAFVSCHTREMCSKSGRELLCLIAAKHPFILSVLIHCVKDTMTHIGMVSLYLFRELPFHQWMPREEDIIVIYDWLLTSQLTSPQNQLARLILGAMNWGLTEKQELFLALPVHRRVALMVVEAHNKLIPGKGNLLTESIKQVTNIASVVRSNPTPEQAFCQWAWDLLLRLKVHLFSQPVPEIRNALAHPQEIFMSIPSLQEDDELHPIVHGLREKLPAACYGALSMTTMGHSIGEFEQNIWVLSSLIENQQYREAIHILSMITDMYHTSNTSLSKCEKFLPLLQSLLTCDLTYMKMAKSLVLPEFPGKFLQMLVAMILHQAEIAPQIGSSASTVFLQWLDVLTNLHQWNRDRNILYVVDAICRSSFTDRAAMLQIRTFFFNYYRKSVLGARASSSVTSFLWWVATGSVTQPLLLPKQSCPEFPWFAYCALDVQTALEDESLLWKELSKLLQDNPIMKPEVALKKAAQKLKMPIPPVLQLAIYHWGQQSLETPMDHPISPVLWQRFFALYLQRWPPEIGQICRGSVGGRFYESMSQLPQLKRMKKRLQETADFHFKKVKEAKLQAKQDIESHGSDSEEIEKIELEVSKKSDYHEKLGRLFSTLVLWIEESRLHDGSLYLPALPSQYDAPRLLQLLQNDKTLWLDFVDFDAINQLETKLKKGWINMLEPQESYRINKVINILPEEENGIHRILKRLKTYEEPKSPPAITIMKAPIPLISDTILISSSSLLLTLQEHLKVLTEFARLFSQRVSQHSLLDCAYLELLPSLYRNVDTELTMVVSCQPASSSFLRSSEPKCSGPACVTLRFKEKKLMEGIENRIEQNRNECQELLDDSLQPPPQAICSAAVFIENVIVHLIKKFHECCVAQQSVKKGLTKQCRDIGVSLFYHLTSLITDETNQYPPTRQFLSASIEILGQEFVGKYDDQCEPLLKLMLDNPSLLGLLAPHFNPNATNKETFIQLYSQMDTVTKKYTPDLAFVLLNKFDVPLWLRESQPKISERQCLMETLGDVLLNAGQNPTTNMLPICEIYLGHMDNLLLYQFPDHYGDCLKILFKGSELQTMCLDVWHHFLNSMLLDTRIGIFSDCDPESMSSLSRKFAQTQIIFTSLQLRETLELFHAHFLQKRLSSKDISDYGLYSRYQVYVPPIQMFLSMISHAYITSERQNSKSKVFDKVIQEFLWPVIRDAFVPWLQPIQSSGKILPPWIPSDSQLATNMVLAFRDTINFLHQMSEYSTQPLNFFLDYYVETFCCHNSMDYILGTCNQVFFSLVWSQFHPDLKVMDLLMKLLESKKTVCLNFLASIFIQLQWPMIMEHYANDEPHLTTVHFLRCFIQLLVKLSFEQSLKEGEDMMALMQSAQGFPWHFLDYQCYNSIVQWFVTNCNPDSVLIVNVSPQDVATLRLLQIAASFVSGATHLHPESSMKRVSYIRSWVQLLCAWTNKNKSGLKLFTDAIADLVLGMLQDTEAVIATSTHPSVVAQESTTLLSEILNILNCASVAALQDIVIQAIRTWTINNPRSQILIPCLSSTCHNLASVIHMATLAETIIVSHFSVACLEPTADGGWGGIVAAVQIPELSHKEFLAECLKQNSLLTLYATVLHRLPICKNIQEELSIFGQLINWSTKMRPVDDSEPKILLLWGKVLELAVRAGEFQHDLVTITSLLKTFCQSLMLLGEDKTSSGLLGVIGLGKKSNLSLQFRLAARAVAAFLLSQIPSIGVLRLDNKETPRTPTLSPTSQKVLEDPPVQQLAVQALAQLDYCKSSKQYSTFHVQVEYISSFITDKQHTLREYHILMAYLASNLFPEKHYLTILNTTFW